MPSFWKEKGTERTKRKLAFLATKKKIGWRPGASKSANAKYSDLQDSLQVPRTGYSRKGTPNTTGPVCRLASRRPRLVFPRQQAAATVRQRPARPRFTFAEERAESCDAMRMQMRVRTASARGEDSSTSTALPQGPVGGSCWSPA